MDSETKMNLAETSIDDAVEIVLKDNSFLNRDEEGIPTFEIFKADKGGLKQQKLTIMDRFLLGYFVENNAEDKYIQLSSSMNKKYKLGEFKVAYDTIEFFTNYSLIVD